MPTISFGNVLKEVDKTKIHPTYLSKTAFKIWTNRREPCKLLSQILILPVGIFFINVNVHSEVCYPESPLKNKHRNQLQRQQHKNDNYSYSLLSEIFVCFDSRLILIRLPES